MNAPATIPDPPANAGPAFDPVRLPLTPYEQSCADAYAARCASYYGDDAPAGHEQRGFYAEIQRRGD